jgi:type VI secretion system protein VasG
VVKVEEPDDAVAMRMLRGTVASLEKHHGVSILDEAVTDSVKLSRRYIPGRQLPDKAVSLLDTACARVAMGQVATPPAIEDARGELEALATTIAILEREQQLGGDHARQIGELQATRASLTAAVEALQTRFAAESKLVGDIHTLHRQISQGHGPGAASARDGRGDERQRLVALERELAAVQGEHPLVIPAVNGQAIAEVVSSWTGIPVGRMVADEIRGVLDLRSRLEARIVGQSQALEGIAQRIRTSRAGLTDPRRPVGVFLLAGPSGVGKTETALALADLLFGGEGHMTIINMSEFKEEHKVSLLMGSPPGYVGYGEGGVLTEAVRRRPYSVVLLDEMEKAHPGVQDLFYQVFDKGMLKDGEGRDIDFKNTVILMTSNVGTDTVLKLCADPATSPDAPALAEALRPDLLRVFKPAFLGRVTVVPYYPLPDDVMARICALKLDAIRQRIAAAFKASFAWRPEVVEAVVARCREVGSGARNIDHVLTGSMLPELSSLLLARMAEGKPVSAVEVALSPTTGGFNFTVT